jgi:hypothetical protein
MVYKAKTFSRLFLLFGNLFVLHTNDILKYIETCAQTYQLHAYNQIKPKRTFSKQTMLIALTLNDTIPLIHELLELLIII